MDRLAAIPERSATFHEEKHFSILAFPLTSQGRLAYRRPAHFEKITDFPLPESLVVDGNRLTLVAGNEAPHSFVLASQPEIAALVDAVRGALAGNLALLERHYRIEARGGPAAWRLTLLPVAPELQRLLHDIAIEGAGTDIRSIRLIQADGDWQMMTIAPAP